MRTRRVLQILSGTGLFVLLLILLTLVVTALDQPIGALIVLGATAVAVVAGRIISKRVPTGTVLELDLDAGVVEKPATDLPDRIFSRGATVIRDITDALKRGSGDDRIVGLVVRLGNGGLTIAQAQELRDAVRGFRASGKKTVAFSESFGESSLSIADYYLAAMFEEIHMLPMGTVSIQGVASRTPFLRGIFDRVGIEPDFGHRREYKAMKYLLTEDHYVPPHREATEAILSDYYEQVIDGIAEDRDLDRVVVQDIIDRAPLYGEEAVEAGLIDRIAHRDEAYETAKGDGKGFMFLDEYLKRAGRPHRRGSRIALVYGTGSITRGSSGFDPMTRGSAFGADDVAQGFREARDDRKVKAIVFRVDSPGGSAMGSEVVHRELLRAREAGKPVVVSMGSVAGSGGYYVSAPADRIVAQPATVTGSIGVVFGKLATGDAWRRIGISWSELSIGRNAGFNSPIKAYSESERQRLEAGLDAIYEGFKGHVAEGRSMNLEQVEEVAKGRVWTGAEAKEIGLVDELGGLDRAIELARELAQIEEDAPLSVQVYPKKGMIPVGTSKPSSEPLKDLLAVLSSLSPGAAPLELRMPDSLNG
jgi:protease-4